MDAEDRVKARLAGMMALVYSVQGAFWPVLSLHLVDLGISERGRGWIFGTMAMASFAIPLGAGQLVDRLMPTQRFLSLSFGAGTVLLAVMGPFPGRFGPVFLVPCAINAALLVFLLCRFRPSEARRPEPLPPTNLGRPPRPAVAEAAGP